MKTAVVTGSNTGIGFETAAALVSQGYRTVLACRDVDKGQAAVQSIVSRVPGGKVETQPLDLADFASVRQFAKDLKAKKSSIDVLVNNAGVMACPQMKTKDGLELQMGVNHFGHFLLTSLLYPSLKQSGARIVNLSSSAHRAFAKLNFEDINNEKKYSRWPVYCQSKLANVLFTYELARRIPKEDNVTANVCHPGIVATELQRYLIPEYLNILFKPLTVVMRGLIKNPAQGAATSIHLATSPEVVGVTGKYFKDCKETKSSSLSYNEDDAKRLWELSVSLTGAQWNF